VAGVGGRHRRLLRDWVGGRRRQEVEAD
jgi:hypothetical protein